MPKYNRRKNRPKEVTTFVTTQDIIRYDMTYVKVAIEGKTKEVPNSLPKKHSKKTWNTDSKFLQTEQI